MQAGSRRNIYPISELLPDTDNRNLQQFITHSKWSAREVLTPNPAFEGSIPLQVIERGES
jgi:hypothetical protein